MEGCLNLPPKTAPNGFPEISLQEKTNKDHTIRGMNDEIAHQDELINKLNKEKKHIAESQSKQTEDLGAAEEKLDHLNKIKAKLEQTLDELEDSLQSEKKARLDLDKSRRKVEGDIKVAQEQGGRSALS